MPGIESADVLVAGSDIDTVNLGATTLARRVRPDIFVVIRQNQMQDRALVEAARANLKFVQSRDDGARVPAGAEDADARPLHRQSCARPTPRSPTATLERVRREVGEGSPHAWTFECDVLQPGMFYAFFQRAARRS